MNRSSQRGSAILMLFIAVALFGALGYAFLQGSRNSTSMITGEAAKATAYQSQDCSNAVTMAGKRLTARGCTTAQISNDTSGAVGAGPADGSCAIYHPNGGGVKGCGYVAPVDCTMDPVGSVCTSDGAVYIGTVSSNRIYAAPADEALLQWKTTNTTTAGTSSTTDGFANTNAMVTAGIALHPAAQACVNKTPAGTWYLPAEDELYLVWTNRASIGLTAKGFNTSGVYYLTSTEENATQARYTRFTDGYQSGNLKSLAGFWYIRCVRR